GLVIALGFAMPLSEAVLIGAVMMFSSTIIGIKLLPTTTLHHRHTGQIIISVLLLQDVVAIIVLLLLQGYGKGGNLAGNIIIHLVALPLLLLFSWLLQRFLLMRLIIKFDQIHEYIFLVAIAWCMTIAELAVALGLSREIGAFLAGVTLASSPITFLITEKLKPLRDFFLILFFFSLGALFDMSVLPDIIIPALVLAAAVLLLKPLLFKMIFIRAGKNEKTSQEVGFRLGQISEFSFLIAVLAVSSGYLQEQTSYLIQLTTLLTFLVSSYLIVKKYPTPISTDEKLRRD
ncbi:MAG: cation:proton antiporter, partial [Gammaproteobacteria bacterium]